MNVTLQNFGKNPLRPLNGTKVLILWEFCNLEITRHIYRVGVTFRPLRFV